MDFGDILNRISADYSLFLYALTGRYLTAITPGAEVSPKSVIGLQDDGYTFARTFLDGVKRTLSDYFAPALSGMSLEGQGAIRDHQGRFLNDLYRVTVANVTTVSKQLKLGRGEYAKAIKEPRGVIADLVQKRMENPNYKIQDSAKRQWDAKKYVWFTTRDFLYQSLIEIQLMKIRDAGGDLAQVVYDDPSHANNGLVFSITGATEGYPNLTQIQAKVFHPNATAKVQAYVSPQS